MTSLQAHELFAPAGVLAQRYDWFDARPEQREMAVAVEKALSGAQTLFVEAGTGVGKSMAYLLPAVLWAVREKKRVVVATHTRALQEQLIDKDLPRVQKVLGDLGVAFQFALLMGGENYLCVQRLHRAMAEPSELFEAKEMAAPLAPLADWAKTADTGLRSRLPFSVAPALWERIHRDPDICLGRRGPYAGQCLFRKDYDRAREATVLVVNHALFFAGGLAGTADAVIFDEAHNLEAAACQYFGFSISSRSVVRLLHEILNPATGRGFAARLKRGRPWKETVGHRVAFALTGTQLFFERVRDALKLSPSAESDAESPSRRILAPLSIADEMSPALEAVARLLRDALDECSNLEEETELRAYVQRLQGTMTAAQAFLTTQQPDFAWWAEATRYKQQVVTSLSAAPLDISEQFAERVLKGYSSAIFTSATLAGNGSFDLVRSQLGASKAQERLLASPFRYEEQAGLYIASDLPDPKMDPEKFEAAALERCQALLPLIPGGVFILFTSWGFLNRAERLLQAKGRPVFKQGSAPPSRLVDEFKRAGNGVLLGTSTFWEGVDVPGAALSAVVLTKLPFTSPTEPYEEAKLEWLVSKGTKAFQDYQLPKAIVKFRQGFGRLIRSRTDTGIVAVLDPRVKTKGYGVRFLRAIPRCHPLNSLQDVERFFGARQPA